MADKYKVTLSAELITLVDAYGADAYSAGFNCASGDYEVTDDTKVDAARTALLKGIARTVIDAYWDGRMGEGQKPIIHEASAPRTGQ